MVNQIIQKEVDIFESFVKEHFIQEQDYYIYNIEVFKKLLFESLMVPFLESLKPYYYKNKHYYLERSPMTYNYFNTILRQIFKRNQIHFVKIRHFFSICSYIDSTSSINHHFLALGL